MLNAFPAALQDHPRFTELKNVVSQIDQHEAMRIRTQSTLDNMARVSLLATICFYGHLMGCIKGEIDRLVKASLFWVTRDTSRLDIFRQMVGEEITAMNIPTEASHPSPHFVPMYESAVEMGLDLSPVDRFLNLVGSGIGAGEAASLAGFHPALINYFAVSATCAKSYEGCIATVSLRENTLSIFFSTILEHLPPDKKYDKYRVFLKSHVMLDSEDRDGGELNHGQLMLQMMSSMVAEQPSLSDTLMNSMVTFYQARKAAYDACLGEVPVF